MKKIIGWICTFLVVVCSWVPIFILMAIIAGLIWPGEETTVPILYALALLIVPVWLSIYCGIKFKKSYDKKHGNISPATTPKIHVLRIAVTFIVVFLVCHIVFSRSLPVGENNVLQAPDWYAETGFGIALLIAVLITFRKKIGRALSESIKKSKQRKYYENISETEKYKLEKTAAASVAQTTVNDVSADTTIDHPALRNFTGLKVDELFPAAVDVVMGTGQASVSMLQRKLKLGYARSAQIMDEMEKKGIVGPFMGSKPRKILITENQWIKIRENIETNQELPEIPNVSSYDFIRGKDSLPDIDGMEGHEFERWCAEILNRNGFYNVEVTRGSGDQGVDILAKKDGIRYAIQCKCYSKDLGNRPVQEVNAGKTIYHCQIGAVMTNRYFTQGAKDAAEATGVLLWDRDYLQKLVAEAAKLGKQI